MYAMHGAMHRMRTERAINSVRWCSDGSFHGKFCMGKTTRLKSPCSETLQVTKLQHLSPLNTQIPSHRCK
eukprot:2502192-Rhodomonas_salina.2